MSDTCHSRDDGCASCCPRLISNLDDLGPIGVHPRTSRSGSGVPRPPAEASLAELPSASGPAAIAAAVAAAIAEEEIGPPVDSAAAAVALEDGDKSPDLLFGGNASVPYARPPAAPPPSAADKPAVAVSPAWATPLLSKNRSIVSKKSTVGGQAGKSIMV